MASVGLGAAAVLMPIARARPDDQGQGEVRIAFVSPASWRCSSDASCTMCRNVDAADADVLVWSAGGQLLERHRVAAGAVVRICLPADQAAACGLPQSAMRCEDALDG